MVTRQTASLVRDAVVEAVDPVEIILFGGACYHAQQSVEKSIKTMLLDRGWDLERIHSIHRLAAMAEDYRLPTLLRPADIDFMDEIYRGRYPAESGLLPLGTPTRDDAEPALSIAKRAVGVMHEMLAKRE